MITCHRIGGALLDVHDRFPSRYGIGDSGVVLVRPDGFIAWRTEFAVREPGQRVILDNVLRSLLFTDTEPFPT